MTTTLVVFLVSLALDWLTVHWHYAREQQRITAVGLLSATIEFGNWLPIWLAIVSQDVIVVLASVVGSALGSMIGVAHGVRKARQREEQG